MTGFFMTITIGFVGLCLWQLVDIYRELKRIRIALYALSDRIMLDSEHNGDETST
jgi:hypothetical protein